MPKIVLCVDDHNSHMEEAAGFLASKDCKIYTLQGLDKDALADIIKEIEEKEGRMDLLLLSANETLPEDGPIGSGHDDRQLLDLFQQQIGGIQAVMDAAIPLLKKGSLKRIGMLTDLHSSISLCQKDKNYGRHMVSAGLNMLGRLYFNRLRPEGFTFRWYCTSHLERGGMSAGEYMLTGLCYDPKEPYQHSDENRFVMRDRYLREIPF